MFQPTTLVESLLRLEIPEDEMMQAAENQLLFRSHTSTSRLWGENIQLIWVLVWLKGQAFTVSWPDIYGRSSHSGDSVCQ